MPEGGIYSGGRTMRTMASRKKRRQIKINNIRAFEVTVHLSALYLLIEVINRIARMYISWPVGFT